LRFIGFCETLEMGEAHYGSKCVDSSQFDTGGMMRVVILLLTVPAVALVLSSPLRAETPSEDSNALSEIIVTATRRPEKLQEVPISMSVVGGKLIEDLGLKNFNDYANLIPNLSVGTGAGAGGAGTDMGVSSSRAVTIRGVAGNNTTALYLNDTPIPLSLDPRAIDIERIEVLRGPQGTLFGAGSMGGTVRIVTRAPSVNETSGRVEAEGSYVDHGGGGYSADAMANISLVPDNLGLRVSAFSAFDPGLYTRTWGGPLDPRSPSVGYPPGGAPIGQKDHVGADQLTGLMASLDFEPAAVPGLSITPLFMYQRSNMNGYPVADYTPNDFVQTRPLNVPESVVDTWSFGSLTLKHDMGFGRFIAIGTYFYRNAADDEDTTDVTAIVFYNLPYYVPSPVESNLISRTWTGEARFESTFKGPFQFVAGVFDSLDERQFVQEAYSPGLNAASGGTLGTDLGYSQNSPNADRQRAVFVDATYHITDELQVTAGERYAYLAHEGTYIANGPLNGGFSDEYTEHGEHDTAPRLTAKYQITPNQMIYASAAKGFRIGGTNPPLPSLCDGNLASLGIANGQPFKTDSLWSYELGIKNSWANNRLQTRLAVYRIDWKGIQETFYLPCTFPVTANSGAATSTGAEFELDYKVLEHLTVNLAGGYEDAKITEANAESDTYVGEPLNQVPKWTGSMIAQYSVPIETGVGFLRGDWTYTGFRTSFNESPPPTGLPLHSYALLNLRTGFSRGPLELSLFARNLLNKYGEIGDLIPEGAVLSGRPRLFVTRPRTVGIGVKFNF
jgi:iron complex outermembrane receptor protein